MKLKLKIIIVFLLLIATFSTVQLVKKHPDQLKAAYQLDEPENGYVPRACFTVKTQAGMLNTNESVIFGTAKNDQELGATFNFDARCTIDKDTSLSDLYFIWDFGDGAEEWAYGKGNYQTEHIYWENGTYTVKLTISDPNQNAHFYKQTVKVVPNEGPHIQLDITPEQGTFNEEFTFDASGTYHNQFQSRYLEYRWDYEGDGLWDTDWSDESDTDWKYSVSGAYEPTVQVRDSDGNLDQTSINITIGSEGFAPEAKFTISVDSRLADKDVGTTDTEFTFNATTSKDEETSASALQVRWDYEGDGEWDTTFSDDTKYAYHTYTEAAEYIPTLEVMDSDGNVATYDYEIRVVENTPPNATFDVDPKEATPGVEFTFDAGSCSDDQYKSAYLEVRWDYEGDGTWDTNFSTTKSSRHYYDDSGTYDVVVQVKDPEGQTAEASEEITVLSNTVPVAAFTVSPDNGTYSTAFAFDASSSARFSIASLRILSMSNTASLSIMTTV